ncbi:MAG: lipid-A-disaccharide synthase [Acidobacteriota bacterium]|nr:lipid-A-disaccharide synthase [Acidobacteriota bacterium]
MKSVSQEPAAPILVVAGEASGDMYAAELVQALGTRLGASGPAYFGCGGPALRQAGMEILVDNRQLSVLGPFEAVSHLGRFFAALRQLETAARQKKPRWAILVDFPDFNLPLAKRLKRQGIGVFYFISPQVWAWRKRRVHALRRWVDRMIVILPFEADFYRRYGMQVEYVGHPLVDRVKTSCSRAQFLRSFGLVEDRLTISLLPGSRSGEIRFNLPAMARTARRLQWEHSAQFLVPLAAPSHARLVRGLIRDEAPGLSASLVENDTYNSVGHSDLAVVSSGTATLEAALLGTPLIAVFRISIPSWIVGQYLIDVPYYSLVNLIAGRGIIPELYQQDFTDDRLYAEIRKFLTESGCSARARMALSGVREKLGRGGAVPRAAESIASWMEAGPKGG